MPLLEFVALIGLVYIFILFLIAYFGDSDYSRVSSHDNSNVVYALSLAVYCSSWTFYGAVGTAAVDGLDYLAIYLGPFLVFVFGYPMMRRIIIICKENNITSISDFISSRYGKSRRIGILVTVIAVIGSIPYIALQLKAVASTFLVMNSHSANGIAYLEDNVGFLTGAALAIFAILFGTRHLDATEHHKGMILAISFESIVKLIAILAVGYFAMYLLFSPDSLTVVKDSDTLPTVNSSFMSYVFTDSNGTLISFLTKTLLSMSAIFLLPRQFQVTIVEARDHHQFKTAQWVMPVYLILTSVIVIPITLSGLLLLPDSKPDLYVLMLPLMAGNESLAILAFIGGLSAATGMVIVASVSLSTMVCNDLVMPYLISIRRLDILNQQYLEKIILLIRRGAIIVLLIGAYGYFSLIDNNAQLANIGLISFSAIVQFLPAVLCALYWRRAHSKGVFWGLVGGFLMWSYTLMLPTILGDNIFLNVINEGNWLYPQALFGVGFDNPLTHGVVWSLAVNIGFLIYFSMRESQPVLEEMQANRFFFSGTKGVNIGHADDTNSYMVHPEALRVLSERIIGARNTYAIFDQHQRQTGINLNEVSSVNKRLISLVQTAIAGVIGTASAQKVISDTVMGGEEYLDEMTTLVDETSSVLKFNRNLLQTTLENITHGISVIDHELNLVIWNDRYLALFDYPENFIFVGKPIKDVLQYNAQRGDFGDLDKDEEMRKRLRHLVNRTPYQHVRTRANDVVIKSIGEPMPGGGFVTTYEDITESVVASSMLRKANEELEDRVSERTMELEVLTDELQRNMQSKTHFLAAASHDLLQPINAARLFAHSVQERSHEPTEVARLAKSIDHSLVTANQLLRALLDVSKLDAGGIEAEISSFDLNEFIQSLSTEMQQTAHEKGIVIESNITNFWVKTDQRLLLSMLQNFVSNAIRYTDSGGGVSICVAQHEDEDGNIKISVIDNGIGVREDEIDKIFNEFYQIKSQDRTTSSGGLGLGLSIVRRISRLLNLKIDVESTLGVGSTFSIFVPATNKVKKPVQSENKEIYDFSSARLKGVEVLVIDNDLSVLDAMDSLLQGWGCLVTSVTSYERGLEMLTTQHFKIVLADYRLDFEQTGLDFLAVVKDHNNQGKNKIESVLITAEQDSSLQEQAEAFGSNYLAKPIEPAALKALMLFLIPSE